MSNLKILRFATEHTKRTPPHIHNTGLILAKTTCNWAAHEMGLPSSRLLHVSDGSSIPKARNFCIRRDCQAYSLFSMERIHFSLGCTLVLCSAWQLTAIFLKGHFTLMSSVIVADTAWWAFPVGSESCSTHLLHALA